MELLDSYLRAVRRYLPRKHRDDIVAELSDELRQQLDSRAAKLGHTLTDPEQMAVLKEYGDPMTVARRYRTDMRSLTIGWELVGPELFPMYLIFLSLNLLISVAATAGIMIYIHQPVTIGALLRSAFIQILCVTLTFTILNAIRRKYPQPWYYPPAELAPMIPISRWYSISGLVVWITFTSWWMAIPVFPRLFLGSAAEYLRFAPSWYRFYWPLSLLLLAGIAQRAINFKRPQWTWLLPSARLCINAIALGLQYPMLKSHPYVLVANGFLNSAHAAQVGDTFNNSIYWGLLSWLWIYHLVGAMIYAWYSAPLIRRVLARKREAVRLTQEINGLI